MPFGFTESVARCSLQKELQTFPRLRPGLVSLPAQRVGSDPAVPFRLRRRSFQERLVSFVAVLAGPANERLDLAKFGPATS